MIVRKFLASSREVSSGEWALGLAALARGYLQSGLSPDLRREAGAAMAAVLDDPSPQVRRALAEVLADEAKAPRHVVIALAHDQPDIAALVLAQSPMLGDGDLVDWASMGDRLAQSAIASRPNLSAVVAAMLAEKGHATATTGQGCLLRPLVSFVLRDCAITHARPLPQLQALCDPPRLRLPVPRRGCSLDS